MDNSRSAVRFAEWTVALPDDARAVWQMVGSDKIGRQGRRVLAGAISYILTRLDLIPDHESGGSVDDTMVLRIAAALASEHAADASVGDSARLGRLANDEDAVKEFLGDALFAKFRRYVLELADKEVRGRTTDKIINDEKARADMTKELEVAIKQIRPARVDDEEQATKLEAAVKSYFSMKLRV
jgi:uncharacterized membrane protein YkvA (DUF1232 family)